MTIKYLCKTPLLGLSTSVDLRTPLNYLIQVQDAGGCSLEKNVEIAQRCKANIYAPNILAPDRDQNGYFTFFSDADFEIEIMQFFDRWGNKMAEYRNLPGNVARRGWDGRFNGAIVQPGVYVYWARLRLEDGTVIQQQGEVTVVH